MNNRIQTYDDLVEEKKRLQALLEVHKAALHGDVEGIKQRLGASKQQVAELWLALRVKTDDFAIEYATAAFQVAAQSFTETGERLEHVPVARQQPHTVIL